MCGDAPAVPLPFLVVGVELRHYDIGGGPWTSTVPNCPLTAAPYPAPTPAPGSPVPCRARYAVVAAWQGGFRASLRLTLAADRWAFGWSADWRMPDGQSVTSVRPSERVTTYLSSSVVVQHPPDQPDRTTGAEN